MNNFQCSISDREMFRDDFSPEFLADAEQRVTMHGHDPYNNIGRYCGVSWGRVLLKIEDAWFRDEADHVHFRNIMQFGVKKADEMKTSC